MNRKKNLSTSTLPKVLTGIQGLDEITFGGLPKGRPSLICGGAGSGKTLFAMEFIVNGAVQYNEPGIFISFEETPEELMANVKSLGFQVEDLIKKKLMDIDFIRVEKSEIEITGEFDLEGLFIRLGYTIDSIGAKRIALDTIESLFSGISNHAILRAELRRLFRWLKDKGVTAVITGERGGNTLTTQGLEEYVSDCVILLDHRIADQYGTRRLRIVKYRGSHHGTNEYPFLINESGISVIPITSLKLDHQVSKEIISTGVPDLDEMFEGKGFYRGSTVLVSGTAGSGKTSLLASFINKLCINGEKCIYISLEESEDQILRNMRSIGIDLKQWKENGLLKFHITRPTYHSIEMHLAIIYQIVNEFKPSGVVMDPISNLSSVSNNQEAGALLTRLVDFMKIRKITLMFSNLTAGGKEIEGTDVKISSIVDTWLLLQGMEKNGERNRTIFVLKSRGMKHSNQLREFLITDKGIKLQDVFVHRDGVLVGSARKTRELLNKKLKLQKENDKKNLALQIERLKKINEAKIAALQSEYETKVLEIKKKFYESIREEDLMIDSWLEDAKRRQEIKKNKARENNK